MCAYTYIHTRQNYLDTKMQNAKKKKRLCIGHQYPGTRLIMSRPVIQAHPRNGTEAFPNGSKRNVQQRPYSTANFVRRVRRQRPGSRDFWPFGGGAAGGAQNTASCLSRCLAFAYLLLSYHHAIVRPAATSRPSVLSLVICGTLFIILPFSPWGREMTVHLSGLRFKG